MTDDIVAPFTLSDESAQLPRPLLRQRAGRARCDDRQFQRCQGLVMDFGSATGSESEHGMREFYPGKYQFGSQRHIKTLVEKHMVQRVQESTPECEL